MPFVADLASQFLGTISSRRGVPPAVGGGGAGALSYDSFTYDGGGSLTTGETLTYPANAEDGDLIVVLVSGAWDNNAGPINDVAGWDKVAVGSNASDTWVGAYWKFVDGDTSMTTSLATGYAFHWCLLFKNAGGVVDTQLTSTGASLTGVAPEATAMFSNAIALALFAFDDDQVPDGAPFSISGTGWPTSFETNQFLDQADLGHSGGFVTKTMTTPGDTGDVTFTAQASDGWALLQLVVEPSGVSPQIVEYTSNDTFAKADYPGKTYATVVAVGGGGGGGGGADFATGTWGSGGGGGGAGGVGLKTFALADLGTTESVVVGAGGGGGNKNLDGAAGGDSTFGSGGTLVTGGGGGAGIKGNATATGGAGGAGGSGNLLAGGAGGTGGIASGHGTTPSAGSTPGGGGGGAGLSNSQAPSTNNFDHFGAAGGDAGSLSGGKGGDYTGTWPSPGLTFSDAGAGASNDFTTFDITAIHQGAGGGGGVAAQDSVGGGVETAEEGAAGGFPGGGGGGGGGERDSTNTGGAGGAGGAGVVLVFLT